MIDAAIHRVSKDADRVICSVTQGPWTPTGLRPRNEKGGIFTIKGVKRLMYTHIVIARRERSDQRGNLSCLGGRGRGCLYGYSGPVDRRGLTPWR